jgi:hypothetical protein
MGVVLNPEGESRRGAEVLDLYIFSEVREVSRL